MTRSFNETPTTDLDYLRVHIGDIKLGDGPCPDRENITDELLNYFLEVGDGVVGAVPLAFDHLAALWISRPIFGPGELSTIHVDMYRKYSQAAADWRDKGGPELLPVVIGVVSLKREDGYSDAADVDTEYI